jgi:hypothetical protein
MIHYQLRCSQAHEFDGWYRDSAAFDELARRKLLECPHCGDQQVTRALMAPALSSGRKDPVAAQLPAPASAPPVPGPAAGITAPGTTNVPAGPAPAAVGGKMPDQLRAMLQRLRAEVEKNCDYVGERFADEALRIHRGETEARGIYGETSAEDAEALAEEGVRFARIPWVGPAEG